jgi:WD40 repeat protein
VIWVAYAPGGRWLASAAFDGTVRFWDVTGQQAKAIGHVDAMHVQRFAFSPRGKELATAGSDRTVTIWNLPD